MAMEFTSDNDEKNKINALRAAQDRCKRACDSKFEEVKEAVDAYEKAKKTRRERKALLKQTTQSQPKESLAGDKYEQKFINALRVKRDRKEKVGGAKLEEADKVLDEAREIRKRRKEEQPSETMIVLVALEQPNEMKLEAVDSPVEPVTFAIEESDAPKLYPKPAQNSTMVTRYRGWDDDIINKRNMLLLERGLENQGDIVRQAHGHGGMENAPAELAFLHDLNFYEHDRYRWWEKMWKARKDLEGCKGDKPQRFAYPKNKGVYERFEVVTFPREEPVRGYRLDEGTTSLVEVLERWMERVSFCGKDTHADMEKAIRDIDARTDVGYKMYDIAATGNVVAKLIIDYRENNNSSRMLGENGWLGFGAPDVEYPIEFLAPEVLTRTEFFYHTINEGEIAMSSTVIKKLFFKTDVEMNDALDQVFRASYHAEEFKKVVGTGHVIVKHLLRGNPQKFQIEM